MFYRFSLLPMIGVAPSIGLEGVAPIVGTLYVQKWFAGDSKSMEVTIDKKG
ncbi:hypothetical protein [Halomonas sp. SpR8]|uniref:hypothetical protein n=1 Tax=Halomonas sp. SpR8 TaxID=3050463 RepID=UPI0027E42066|nr:hypothetical protein [Halomonas sp. SpR8]MDQ7730694.1 hypothetical protein [Halomonas sp. SpR8]